MVSPSLQQAVAPGSRPTLLRPGTHFHGQQCVNRGGIACEDWQVSVRIEVHGFAAVPRA